MSNIDSTKIIIRHQNGTIDTFDLGTLRLINGSNNSIVAGITASLVFGIPAAFSDNQGNVIVEEKEKNNAFIMGHEQGHIALGHLNTQATGIVDNPEFEHAADMYAVEHGYCTKEEAIKEMQRLKDAILGKGFFRKLIGLTLLHKGISGLNVRIKQMSAL